MSRRGALAAAAGLLLARPAGAGAQDGDPAGTLRALLAREEASAQAYRSAGMARLAGQEAEHARALRPQLEALGQPAPPASPRTLAGAAQRLATAAGDDRDAAAIALERELVKAYRAALGSLDDPALRRTAATIMASHAQHLVVLHRDPLRALG